MKNIRNNWITKPMKELKFFIDEEEKVAEWIDIEIYVNWKANSLLRRPNYPKLKFIQDPSNDIKYLCV